MLSHTREGRITSKFKTTFMNQKVSFADRVGLLGAAVADLRKVLEIIEAEAKAMAQVHQRFAARKPRTANSTE